MAVCNNEFLYLALLHLFQSVRTRRVVADLDELDSTEPSHT